MVAICYYQTIPHIIKVIDAEYAFSVRNNICLSYVKPEHVDTVLNMKKTCCGGNKKKIYRRATDIDEKRWEFGGR